MLVDEVTGTVREHISLEREVTNYWLAKYFEQASARDPGRTWGSPAAALGSAGKALQATRHACRCTVL